MSALAPDFTAISTSGKTVSLKDFRGQNVVLYFYPKDNTPGCTQEGKDFRDYFEQFKTLNTMILGVSRDSLSCHLKFKAKHEFPFELLADPDGTLCESYEVIKHKNTFGIKALGIQRSTFLIDTEGKIQKMWRGVKVTGHIEDILASIRALSA
jgi:thioredoxin-dependent peroxiredoxin